RGVPGQADRGRRRGRGHQRRGAAVRRFGLHARHRGRTPLPRRPHPAHRRRIHRSADRSRCPTAGVLDMSAGPSTDATTDPTAADPTTAEPVSRREAMLAKVVSLHEEQTKAVNAGAKYVERHHARGKLTARERIDLLLDEGSAFLELMPLAAWGTDFPVGASLVVGIGVVEGVECVISANDPTVKGGALNPYSLRKSFRAAEIAQQNNMPSINLTESGGADL